MPRPYIVGFGGTASGLSSTERALQIALAAAERYGADTMMFGGDYLTRLPHYLTGDRSTAAISVFVDAIRAADGIIIASPGYHASISGLVKNAIDYVEETAKDQRIYLDGVPVGLIATAHGWQATSGTLATLRSIVHALRGWPTPLGAAINSAGRVFKDGLCTDEAVVRQLELVGRQVQEFAQRKLKDAWVTGATAPVASPLPD
jgi:FMN reductase